MKPPLPMQRRLFCGRSERAAHFSMRLPFALRACDAEQVPQRDLSNSA
jgi:hypothetical protein